MRRFFTVITLLCVSLSGGAQDSAAPSLRFGVIADIQYCDCDPWYGRHYRSSLGKIEKCVAELNAREVDFTVNLGDLIDRDFADMDTVLHYLDKLAAPVYNLTGNHDYAKVENNAVLYRRLGMPSAYYSFSREGWNFIMLDTNDIASYSNMSGKGKEQELAAMREKIKETGGDNGHSWNGGVGREQLQWLYTELEYTEKRGDKAIIFTHNPLYPFNDHSALNDREILDLLSGFDCVKAVMSGHNHSGGFGYYGGIPCITVRGMVEKEDGNSFCVVELYGDKIVVEGYGEAESHVLDM